MVCAHYGQLTITGSWFVIGEQSHISNGANDRYKYVVTLQM